MDQIGPLIAKLLLFFPILTARWLAFVDIRHTASVESESRNFQVHRRIDSYTDAGWLHSALFPSDNWPLFRLADQIKWLSMIHTAERVFINRKRLESRIYDSSNRKYVTVNICCCGFFPIFVHIYYYTAIVKKLLVEQQSFISNLSRSWSWLWAFGRTAANKQCTDKTSCDFEAVFSVKMNLPRMESSLSECRVNSLDGRALVLGKCRWEQQKTSWRK